MDNNFKNEIRYYANLELPYGAGFDEVINAYHTLLRKYHSDIDINNLDNREYIEKVNGKLNEALNYFENKFSGE